MNFYFVYSSGGGAGDWNAIDRMFEKHMPPYFKNHILIKFGDIFFNHRSSSSLIKPKNWKGIKNARKWIYDNTKDSTIWNADDLIMDVGTSKIVSYITSDDENLPEAQVVSEFDRLLNKYSILDRYCETINESQITNAVTFDIPNLFKLRTQTGNLSTNVFRGDKQDLLIDACLRYANYIYENSGKDADKLMTIINANWTNDEIIEYLSNLTFKPTKIAIGGLTSYKKAELSPRLKDMAKIINFRNFKRVHFLGAGGLDKADIIKKTLGNNSNFSADNTTPYNRGIDGNLAGSAYSGYYDYGSKKLMRINPANVSSILAKHQEACNKGWAYFDMKAMTDILDGILLHQSGGNCSSTYESRAKLIMHNFDVFRFNAE